MDGDCVAVAVPVNGYLDRSGHDWDCERGYSKRLACLTIAVPVNGHLDYSGHSWTCNAGYRPSGEACIEG
jgi:hypothetical protein